LIERERATIDSPTSCLMRLWWPRLFGAPPAVSDDDDDEEDDATSTGSHHDHRTPAGED
jgi:hypothetical protein